MADVPPSTHEPAFIRVGGAREHNLRDVSLEIPRNHLVCFTGVSGSGKSSLAFDTLYAEGQRRYVESLSAYARQFIGQLPKPDVDQITGLAPSISIQQKSTGWNPRSTVATITQIHDYLRVLFARAGVQHCPQCGGPVEAQTREQMVARLLTFPEGTTLLILAPKVQAQKGEHRDLFQELQRQGFVRARVDGAIVELARSPQLDRYKRHTIEVVVDRVVVRAHARTRLAEALELALATGGGAAIAVPDTGAEPAAASESPARPRRKNRLGAAGEVLLSAGFACGRCTTSFQPPTPQMFSSNSPQGMCPACDGLGTRYDFDPDLLVPDASLSFLAPCIVAMRRPPGRWRRHIFEGVARYLGIDLESSWRELPAKARHALLFGTGSAHITFEWRSRHGTWRHGDTFAGVIAELRANHRKASSPMVRGYYEQFMRSQKCDACQGARLVPQALAVRLRGRLHDGGTPVSLNIHELGELSIAAALDFLTRLECDDVRALIAAEPLKEIRTRLRFLLDVGLDYLTLNRPAPTLSGGESQRVRLASQIGCGLVGVLYVLDEPSIGLHPRDNLRLLAALRQLRDAGNTVVVVEHDRDTMESADYVVDFGPGPGTRGGDVVARGTPAEIARAAGSLTGAFLSGREQIEVPRARRPISRPAGRRFRRGNGAGAANPKR